MDKAEPYPTKRGRPMREAVIIDCLRTAVGKSPRGALRHARPDDLAATVIRALLDRYPAAKEDVEDVILGCAMPEGEAGGNMARQAALRAGFPGSGPAMTINPHFSFGLAADGGGAGGHWGAAGGAARRFAVFVPSHDHHPFLLSRLAGVCRGGGANPRWRRR